MSNKEYSKVKKDSSLAEETLVDCFFQPLTIVVREEDNDENDDEQPKKKKFVTRH